MDVTVSFTVNGQRRTTTTDSARPVLEILREDFGLTGTKYGCGEGRCGACTVLLDGKGERSCQLTPRDVADKTLVTIEGLATGDTLHPVQEAFLAANAFQCGYCTPGMILSAVALLNATPKPTDAEITAAMNVNLCRCCGYPAILDAVRRAAGQAR